MEANKSRPGSKLRPDAIDWAMKMVYEPKPFSKSGRRLGTKQVKEYIDFLVKNYGKRWKGQLVFY
jgi:hypothetical protein